MSSVCRVCLVGNTLLHSLKNNMLPIIYEKLTNTKFNSDDARPRVLCSFCYQKLQRCHTFSQMAVRSEKIFNHVYDMGIEVTQDYITEVNQNMKQNMSMATMPFITNDVNAINEGSQTTTKDECLPIDIDIKEEVIIEPDKFLEAESFPKDSANNQSTFKEDISERDNHMEELLSETHIDQSKPDESSFIIENESVSIKSDLWDKLMEIESFPEHRTENLFTFEEDYSIPEKDLDKPLYSIDAEKTKPDDSKLRFSYSCNNCNETFYMKRQLNSHIRYSHSIVKEKRNTSTKKHYKKKRTYNKKKKFPCHLCDETFHTKYFLNLHMRTHTDKQNASNKKLVEDKATDNKKKKLACHLCDETFDTKYFLNLHMRTHTDKQNASNKKLVEDKATDNKKKKLACHLCDETFGTKNFLNLHMRMRTHTDKQNASNKKLVEDKAIDNKKKKLACHLCDETFGTKYFLNLHMRMRTHTDKQNASNKKLVEDKAIDNKKKKLACPCDNTLDTKSHLNCHVRTRTDKKPFACNVCEKQFNHNGNLVNHLRTHTETIKAPVVLGPSAETQTAKMLIFLQNGEQRLITFTLPKESCTLLEVLEQVHVPFSKDTYIQCMQNDTSSEIDYFVSVGSTTRLEEMLEKHPMLLGDMESKSSPTFEDFVKECVIEEDVENILYKNFIKKQIDDEKTKPDDSKMPVSCNNSNKIFDTQRNFISHIRNSYATKKYNGTSSMTEDETVITKKKVLSCLKQTVYRGHLGDTRIHTENIEGQAQCPSADTDSGKMLIFLQNGEQRLITFTLPKENFTIQEVLEQVHVPFSEDTYIQCMQNPTSSEIDYFVSVGSTTRLENMLKNHPMFVTEMGSKSSPSEMARPQSKEVSSSASSSSDPGMKELIVPEPPEQRSPPPRHVDGMLAVCKSCGYTGFDFSRCERCRRVFNEEPKGVPIADKKLNNRIWDQKE